MQNLIGAGPSRLGHNYMHTEEPLTLRRDHIKHSEALDAMIKASFKFHLAVRTFELAILFQYRFGDG